MKTLYLGLKPPPGVTHYPMIRIVPLNPPIDYKGVTHLIVTSQTVLELIKPPKEITLLAVGAKTASKATGQKVQVAKEEQAEGVVELLKEVDPKTAKILYPHSAKARPLIREYLEKGYDFTDIALYDVAYQALDPKPHLADFDKIVFTSPSTVEAFFTFFPSIPNGVEVECIGPITRQHLVDLVR